MTWTTIFLKFPDEATAHAALTSAFGWKDDAYTIDRNKCALDVVGIIYRDDTPEGDPPVPRDGYHVNLAYQNTELPAALVPYAINRPNNPWRVFAC